MLTALALICSLVATPDLRECSKESAVSVFQVPEDFKTVFTCLQHAEAYVASNELGRSIRDDEAVKIVCVHRRLG